MSSLTRIISTRRINEHLKQEALDHGFLIADQDFLSFDYLSGNHLAEVVKNSGPAFVFTSQHAVKAVMRIIDEYQIKLVNKDCFCIEGKTRQDAVEHGFNVLGEAGNSASLALVIAATDQQEVIFFSGNLKREELANTLTANNIKVHEHIVYHKSLLPLKVQEDYQGVMFFSPSQVDAFAAGNLLSREIPAFCIGSTTGEYLHNKGHKNTVVAEQKNTGSVLNKIYEYYK
jgi:uroporphyrinogen-III synthase